VPLVLTPARSGNGQPAIGRQRQGLDTIPVATEGVQRRARSQFATGVARQK
jgi:hypothetical protein